MRFVFRADASLDVGHGHVRRCLTLAGALREQGDTVSFVCREERGDLCDVIEREGIQVTRLERVQSWEADAEETRAAFEPEGERTDWLVVDHYRLDERWERALRDAARHILVIDDVADRKHDCDVLLDQNFVAGMQTRYDGKAPPSCRMLLGTQYALLQPEFARLHDTVRPRSGAVSRILISFGGADRFALARRSLSAFLSLNRDDVAVDVVAPENGDRAQTVRALASGRKNVFVHSDLPSLAPLMALADLAIGAGGSTSWERLCLGLPSLVVTIAENQRPIADALNDARLIRWVGHENEVDESSIASAIEELLEVGIDEEWSLRCLSAVDGRGRDRVRKALNTFEAGSLRVRAATAADEAILLEWANDPETRRNSFSRGPISSASHHEWFQARLGRPADCHIYIVETSVAIPVGQVRFERAGAAWETNYSLSRDFRGRGLGRVLMELGLLQLSEEVPRASVLARAKKSNVASCRVFESLGFDANPEGDTVEFHRVLE
jgi:UDP-2,4-diacetamido-2,4,6-trideoxy-beta-L-altropyranose hydrolase